MSLADSDKVDCPPLRADALAGIELFDGLSRSVRQHLIVRAQPRRYQRGELLYAEGDIGGDLLLLLSGVVLLFRGRVRSHRAVLAAVRPPSVLGEEALAGKVPRFASAEALHDSFALALPEPVLVGLMQQHVTISAAARRWLALRLTRLAEQRADDVLLDLSGRVAKTVACLAAGTGTQPKLAVTQGILAALARGSRQGVNRALKGFEDRGWLRLEQGRIVVLDIDALTRRAGCA
jgi:CRP/FNR family transcriptional regulator, cyclic AMP receptor protein